MASELAELNASFLGKWSAQQQQLASGSDDTPVIVPWRLSFTTVRSNAADVRANCQEWVLRHLDEQACPHPLAEFICSQALSEIGDADLKTFSLPLASPRSPSAATAALAATYEKDDVDVAEEDELLDGMKLCQYALTACRKVCLDIVDGRTAVPEYDYKWLWNASTEAIRNRRRKMEDRHVVIPYLEILAEGKIADTSLYAVFDGHRGADAAEFAAAHLPHTLLSNSHFENDLLRALEESLKEVDRQFLEYADAKGVKAGCTALVVCIRNIDLCCAWIGDSQLLVSSRSGDDVRIVTKPHSASLPEEQDRIDGLGGIVIQASGSWRVSGQIAVSRAIGDTDLKKYLVSDCDMVSVEIADDFEFIVLGCDGVWDAKDVSLDAMREEIEKCRDASSEKLTTQAARALVDLARTGSDDNISAIVVDLKNYRNKVG